VSVGTLAECGGLIDTPQVSSGKARRHTTDRTVWISPVMTIISAKKKENNPIAYNWVIFNITSALAKLTERI